MKRLLILLMTISIVNCTYSNNSANTPSLKQLEMIFQKLERGESFALIDYGFALVDKQSQKSTYYNEDVVTTIIKEVYKLNDSNRPMTVVHVYNADKRAEMSLTIVCSSDIWNQLQNEYSLRNNSEGSTAITFHAECVLSIESENSIHWTFLDPQLSFAELVSVYNEKQNRYFVCQLLASRGLCPVNGYWCSIDFTIDMEAKGVRVEHFDDDGNFPSIFVKWTEEAEKLGYLSKDSSYGAVRRTDYQCDGRPIVSCGIESKESVFCIGCQVNF